MTTAKVPANLAEARAALQSKLPDLRKTRTARVRGQNKNGIEFNYSYAYVDLATINAKLLPVMTELGLSFSSAPTIGDDGRFVLAYALQHVSGESDGGRYPLPDPLSHSPQQIGSAITYARRYCLCAVTGISPGDDDDDARSAQDARSAFPEPKRRIERVRGTAGEADQWSSVDGNGERRPAGELPEDKSPAAVQVGWAMQHFRRLGFKDADRAERLAIAGHFAGFDGDLATMSELGDAQMKALLRVLEKSRDRSHLEARYEAERAQALAESGDPGA